MNPAALSPALFTAPTTSAQAPASAGSPQTGGQDSAPFSRLLDSSSAITSEDTALVTSSTALAAVDDGLAEEVLAMDTDAPWPPAGLETLLAPPASVTANAPVLPLALDGADDGVSLATQTVRNAVAGSLPLADSTALAASGKMPTAALSARAGALPAAALQANPTLASSNEADNLALSTADMLLGPAAGSPPPALAAAAASAADNGGMVAMAALTATAGASPLPANDSQASVLPTRADMGGEHFDADVAQSVEYMLDHKLQSARIRISPQQMGMIEVELRLDGDRVHANFSSAHADVRQALQDALPRLREMLDASGLQMGQAAVGDHASGQQPGATTAQGQTSAGSLPGNGDGEPSASTAPAPVWRHNRLLDTYA